MKENKNWKEQLYELKQKRDRPDDPTNIEQKKKTSRLMYQRRKLDKDVREYVKNNTILRSGEINRIGRRHGYYVSE